MSAFPLTDAARARPGDADLLSVAAHETGHAVVAHELGLRVDSVEVRADATGQCFYRRGDEEGLLAAAVAGEVAELELGVRDPGDAADCAGPDRIMAFGFARRLDPADPDRALHRGAAQARTLLRRYWSAVERLGEVLLEERFIEGQELRSMIDEAVRDADDIQVAAAAAIDRERQASRAFEIMVNRRMAFERIIRDQPLVGQATAWTIADRQAHAIADGRPPRVNDWREQMAAWSAVLRGPGR
jgi:hypothetical protein